MVLSLSAMLLLVSITVDNLTYILKHTSMWCFYRVILVSSVYIILGWILLVEKSDSFPSSYMDGKSVHKFIEALRRLSVVCRKCPILNWLMLSDCVRVVSNLLPSRLGGRASLGIFR